MFCMPLFVLLSMRQCVHASKTMFPQYLQYLFMDFRQTFLIGASWTKMNWLGFVTKGQRSKSHIRGGGIQHLTLPLSEAF